MNINNIKKIHIIGIEGAGTSALARMLKQSGKDVSGSDAGDHFYFDMLSSEGIKVFHEFNPDNIPRDADLVIYSTAFRPETNAELKLALDSNKKVISYSKALGLVFNEKYGLAVAGTHGKTTVTAWLSYVLKKAGYAPSAIIGSKVPQFKSNALVGSSEYMVIEADEYQNKLKNYQPQAVLLNNIEYDHPDFFPSPEDYKNVFIEFIKRIPTKGFLVANFDDPIIRKIARVNCRGRVIGYAINESTDFVAYDIKYNNGKQYFKVKFGVDDFAIEDDYDREDELGEFVIRLLGKHNISNALAVIAACIELNVPLIKIRRYLEEFTGTARRMQIMGEFRGATIIDDYAHHPTEIKATIDALRQVYKNNKLSIVFHPHTFTRTKALLDEFADSFNGADEVIILDIFGSTREKQGGVHSKDLVKKLKVSAQGGPASGWKCKNILYIPTLNKAEEYLRENIKRGDVVALLGAGDVYKIGESLVK